MEKTVEKMVDNQVWYGDRGKKKGTNVAMIYSKPLMAMGIVVLIPTLVSIFSTKSQSPAKKRKRDTCRKPGTASATPGIHPFSNPSCKYFRTRAHFRGSLYRWKTCM